MVLGNAIEKNLVRAEIHTYSRVWLLIAYLGARDGHKPA